MDFEVLFNRKGQKILKVTDNSDMEEITMFVNLAKLQKEPQGNLDKIEINNIVEPEPSKYLTQNPHSSGLEGFPMKLSDYDF